MQFEEAVFTYIKLLEEGRQLDALAQFFADYGVIYANGVVVGEGREACIESLKPQLSTIKNLRATISNLKIDTQSEFCAFQSLSNYVDASGAPRENESLHVQMWAQGKIASEWHYMDEPMQGMISRGLLDDPAHILELLG